LVLSPAGGLQTEFRLAVMVTGQLADTPTRGLDDSWTGYLTDWSTRRLDNSRTGELADWTTRGCHRRLCVLSFRSTRPRVVQLPQCLGPLQCRPSVGLLVWHGLVLCLRETLYKDNNRKLKPILTTSTLWIDLDEASRTRSAACSRQPEILCSWCC